MLFHIEATLDDETWLLATPLANGKLREDESVRVAVVQTAEDVDLWLLYGAVRVSNFTPVLIELGQTA